MDNATVRRGDRDFGRWRACTGTDAGSPTLLVLQLGSYSDHDAWTRCDGRVRSVRRALQT